MKKKFSLTLIIVLTISILSIIGCRNDTTPVGTSPSLTIDSQLATFIAENTSDYDDDAVLFRCSDPMGCDNSKFGSDAHKGANGNCTHTEGTLQDLDERPHLKTKFDSLPLILHCLELTDFQNESAHQITDALHPAIDKILHETRDSQKPFRAIAKTQAKSVLDGIKSGTVNRTDAKVQLDAIRSALNDALKPLRDSASAQIHSLHDAAFARIRTVLKTDRLNQWDTWITTGVSPCIVE